ncbi:MAG TPA: GAF and ANTAR domain-containing protein [Frankiaceae bacterium]|jgi:GAF domain-containing protein|nr:GAF and ANTAR domain-containing protein [Frankiaceae bacterium]
MTASSLSSPAIRPQLPDLAVAYRELQDLLISTSELDAFLADLAAMAVAVIPPISSCGITLRRGAEPLTVGSSDPLADRVDELQYGRGVGPCLEALHTGETVTVTNLATDRRWGDYPAHAMRCGVAASLSLPLTAGAQTVGAMNLYAASPHEFTAAECAQGMAFAAQACGALALVQRHEMQLRVNSQLVDALASRTVIDQAMGVLMGTRRISAKQAFDLLRGQSQRRNVKLHAIAAEVVQTMTSHPVQPPPPFVERE